MDLDKKEFKKYFPHLAKEIEEKTFSISIGGVRSELEADPDELRNPDVISFLRRCSTEKEAEEIIDYMERRGEISKEYAERLRKQLRERGVRSFGPKKEPGYYDRLYRIQRGLE